MQLSKLTRRIYSSQCFIFPKSSLKFLLVTQFKKRLNNLSWNQIITKLFAHVVIKYLMKPDNYLVVLNLFLHHNNDRSCDIIDHPNGIYVAWVPYSL